MTQLKWAMEQNKTFPNKKYKWQVNTFKSVEYP